MDFTTVPDTAIWWLLAVLLIGAELLTPGFFLLWIGIAAAVMGLITWLLPGMTFLIQAVVFSVLAIGICTFYWKVIRPRAERRNDQPLLNQRGAQLVGQHVQVADTIIHGRGKVRVGDSVWLAEGDDAAAGSTVRVIAVQGTTLQVRAIV